MWILDELLYYPSYVCMISFRHVMCGGVVYGAIMMGAYIRASRASIMLLMGLFPSLMTRIDIIESTILTRPSAHIAVKQRGNVQNTILASRTFMSTHQSSHCNLDAREKGLTRKYKIHLHSYISCSSRRGMGSVWLGWRVHHIDSY
jgi:hypothetical protein